MIRLKKLFTLFVVLVFSVIAHAQNGKPVEMADQMRSNGRIYVVVAVMLTILVGLILYIVRIDRSLSKLEKDIK
jgi:succinate dehydrogenase hydrophobic anchor subunit